jgi:hypothetical protein
MNICRALLMAASNSSIVRAAAFFRSALSFDEHEAGGIEIRLRAAPGLTPGRHVGPLLLAGVRRFFEGLIMAIEKAPDRARCQALAVGLFKVGGDLGQRDVAPGGDEPEDLGRVRFDAPPERLSTPCGRGAHVPLARQRCTHFTAVEAATTKRREWLRRIALCQQRTRINPSTLRGR